MTQNKQIALNALKAIQNEFKESEDYRDELLAIRLEKQLNKTPKKDLIPTSKLAKKFG